MLYILGGASRSGKSIIANKLTKEKGIPFFSTDYLMMGLDRGAPEFGVKEEMLGKEVAIKIWPILRSMMWTVLDINQDYLFEGYAILPEQVNEIIQQKGIENIKACFVGYADISPEVKLKEIRQFSNSTFDWISKYDDEFIIKFSEDMKGYSQFLKSECQKYNLKYVDTSENFEVKINEILEYLIN